MATITQNYLSVKVNGIQVNTSCPTNSGNYNNRTSRDVKYIVIHYTGNTDDTALSNAKYFQVANRDASAHFFVDETSIYQGVELRDIAWHCGTSGTYYHSNCRNTNSFGIEMTTAGNYIVSEQTQINSAYLCAELCKLVGITASTVDTYVLRHYDITHKKCPAQYVNDVAQWTKFKTWVKNILNTGRHEATTQTTQPTVSTPQKVNITYAVKVEGGKILPAVTNLDDYAGIENKKIIGLAMKVDKGTIKYQVHEVGGDWLPYVTGYNWNDNNNGYAGNNNPIDAIRAYYNTPSDLVSNGGYREAKYRVSPIGSTTYYSWQLDDTANKVKGMDGYAGAFGKVIDKIQICIE